MVEVLGITPIDAEKSIVDTAYSLISLGVIKKTRKLKKSQEAPAEAPNAAQGKIGLFFLYNSNSP